METNEQAKAKGGKRRRAPIVCAVVAVVLVLPAGGLADRFGPKRVGLVGLACAALARRGGR